MNKWKIVTGIFLIFAIGVLSGVLGTGLFVKHRIVEFRSGAPFMRDRFLMHRLTRELDLTEKQQEKVRGILAEIRTRHKDFFEARRAEIITIINSELTAIKKELTGEQQKKLDRLVEKFRRHRSRNDPPNQPNSRMDCPVPTNQEDRLHGVAPDGNHTSRT